MPNHPVVFANGRQVRNALLVFDRAMDGTSLPVSLMREEISEAHAEGRHGETGHVLVGPEVNREEAIQKSHDEGAQKRSPGRDQYADQRIERGCILLIQEGPDDAADTADVHDAGNSEVQVSGFFGNGFTGTSEKKRYALGDSTRYK